MCQHACAMKSISPILRREGGAGQLFEMLLNCIPMAVRLLVCWLVQLSCYLLCSCWQLEHIPCQPLSWRCNLAEYTSLQNNFLHGFIHKASLFPHNSCHPVCRMLSKGSALLWPYLLAPFPGPIERWGSLGTRLLTSVWTLVASTLKVLFILTRKQFPSTTNSGLHKHDWNTSTINAANNNSNIIMLENENYM